MELYEVMRTTFAARTYTDDPLPDAVLHRILDVARFAPSGGNRQGWRVIAVRSRETREAIAELVKPVARRYLAQRAAGESPFNTVNPSRVDEATVTATEPLPDLYEPLLRAPVVLLVCVDLAVVAAVDAHLDRVGIAGGASVYPFCWNVLLAARAEGYGGVITTLPIAREPELRPLLHLPDHVAVAAVVPLGKPVKQLTRLRRNPVESFTVHETWDGDAFTGS